jgi:hypothetical protein
MLKVEANVAITHPLKTALEARKRYTNITFSVTNMVCERETRSNPFQLIRVEQFQRCMFLLVE